MKLIVKLSAILIILLVCLGVVAHFSGGNSLQTVELTSPARVPHGSLRYEPTIENALTKFATFVPMVELSDIDPYGKDNRLSVFTFLVKSVLYGDEEIDVIRVLGETAFFTFDETYLLILHCHSSTSWPFDIYVPFEYFIFRVRGDRIECLQDAESREFIAPFADNHYNKLGNFSQFVNATAEGTETYAKDSLCVQELIRLENIVIEIQPVKVTQATEINPFVYITEFVILENYRGSYQGSMVLLPQELDVNNQYVIFLEETDEGYFQLASRNSIFAVQTQEYNTIMSAFE